MRILQISCSYFPDKIGGTEVYVHNLSQELLSRGHQVYINYVDGFRKKDSPQVRIKEYDFKGIPVCVIEKNTFDQKTAELYFDSKEKIYPLFKEYLKRIQPDIVHFHHFSSTDVIEQLKAAKEMNLPIIFTYHTSMMSCGHSDMICLGRKTCDGKVEYKKCLICTQTKYKIPFFFALLWAGLSKGIAKPVGESISNLDLKSRFATWLQLPWFTRERIKKWQEGFKIIDHFVAPSQWTYELLLRNGVSKEKITLCRQGVGSTPRVIKKEKKSILQVGYLGRLHPGKGIDVLLEALSLIPSHFNIELSIYADLDTLDKKYCHKLRRLSHKDKRIKWQGLLKEEDKFQVLSQLDCLIIPSRWLETGPLVLLEAWAVGTPVVGADLGGIAELVIQGQGGLLFKPDNAGKLASSITRIYKEPDLLLRLKATIPKVRTMEDVANDMENLYSVKINETSRLF